MSNIQWEGCVKSIYTGYNEDKGTRYAVVNCWARESLGRLSPEDASSSFVTKQAFPLFCVNELADYVEAEIEEGDIIFVVGIPTSKRKEYNGVAWMEFGIQVEKIFKSDYRNYGIGRKLF